MRKLRLGRLGFAFAVGGVVLALAGMVYWVNISWSYYNDFWLPMNLYAAGNRYELTEVVMGMLFDKSLTCGLLASAQQKSDCIGEVKNRLSLVVDEELLLGVRAGWPHDMFFVAKDSDNNFYRLDWGGEAVGIAKVSDRLIGAALKMPYFLRLPLGVCEVFEPPLRLADTCQVVVEVGRGSSGRQVYMVRMLSANIEEQNWLYFAFLPLVLIAGWREGGYGIEVFNAVVIWGVTLGAGVMAYKSHGV